VGTRWRAILAAAALLFTLAELPLACADQVYGCRDISMPYMGCKLGGSIASVAQKAGTAVKNALAEVKEAVVEVAKHVKQTVTELLKPGTKQAAVIEAKQGTHSTFNYAPRADNTESALRAELAKRGWTVITDSRKVVVEVRKQELLNFMRKHESALRGILGRYFDDVYKRIESHHGDFKRILDVKVVIGSKELFVEEKNVATMSTNRLHTYRELITDLYLNLEKGVRVIWHFSDKSTGDVYRTCVHAFAYFRLPYWVGGNIHEPP